VSSFGIDLEALDLGTAIRNLRLGYEESVFES
jgi:hypothetical protein